MYRQRIIPRGAASGVHEAGGRRFEKEVMSTAGLYIHSSAVALKVKQVRLSNWIAGLFHVLPERTAPFGFLEGWWKLSGLIETHGPNL